MSIDALSTVFIQNKPFTTQEAAEILHLTKDKTAKILHRYKKQGHLLMLKKGVYLPVPHKGLTAEESFANPWAVVPIMFPGSYVGGWSATSYWGLTDQLFQITCLISKEKIRHKNNEIGRFKYSLFSNCIHHNTTGEESIWIDQVRVPISDVHRTIIDIIENPKCGAGIQHTIDCLKVYFQEHYNEKTFAYYAEQIKNGVFFKRLGYLVESLFGINHPLCQLAKRKLTKGNSSLDSSISCTKLITRWNLYINEAIDL